MVKQWQLSKFVLSGMYNRNFEAINSVLNNSMKKIEMEYGLFICTIIFYLILCLRFRKEFLMSKDFLHFLVTFSVIVVCRYNYDLNYKHGSFFQLLKVIFNILYTKFCLDCLFYATSTFVSFSAIWSRLK